MPALACALRELMRVPFVLTALLCLTCLWLSVPTYPGSWSIGKYKDAFCWNAPQHSRYGMAAYIDAEMQQLQARILQLQDQKQTLLKAALPKGGQGLCNAECTSRQANVSAANSEQLTTKQSTGGDNTTSFLFIGVLSVAGNAVMGAGRRTAIRQTWMASAPSDVAIKFVLYEKEQNIDITQESTLHQDIIFVPGGNTTDYRSIVFKTFAFVQWVATNVSPNFVVKTDDDAYISCAALVATLKGLCRNPDCRNEGMYFGQEKHNGEVITEIDSKWSNLEYFQLTGLKEYMPYMLGGGYVFSFDVAETLHSMHSVSPLKLMPNEDATFGFWVMGMQLRHIGHPKVRAAAGACCFYSLPEEDAVGRAQHFQIRTWQDLCSGWLILHKVETEAQLAYLHYRLQQCAQDTTLLQTAHQLTAQPKSSDHPHQTVTPKVKPFQVTMMTPSQELFHHWGHSDISPWSADGTLMLSQRVDVTNMQDFMKGNTAVMPPQLGFVNFSAGQSVTTEITGWNWTYAAATSAASLELGSRLQWLGQSSNLIVYNNVCQQSAAQASTGAISPAQQYDSTADNKQKGSNGMPSVSTARNCAHVVDLHHRQPSQTLEWPVYAVSPDGCTAASFNFERLKLAPPGLVVPPLPKSKHTRRASVHPRNDGLWLVDLKTGQAKLLLSLHAIALHIKRHTTGFFIDFFRSPLHCFGHISSAVYNPEGTRVVFKYHANHCDFASILHGARTYTLTVNVDGTDLWKVPVDGNINGIVSCGHGGVLLLSEPTGAHLALDRYVLGPWQLDTSVIFNGAAGACKFHPNNDRFVVCESFDHPRKLYIWDLKANSATTIGNIAAANWPTPETGRQTIHPHFTPDGQYITFDSTHIWETGIQTYIAGVQHLHTVPDPQCNLGTSALSDDPTFKVYGAPELIDKICTAQHSNQQASATTHPPIVSTVDLSNQPAHSSSAQEDRTPAEQRVPRRLLLILALREDTWLTNYISALTEPELWQVHAWQTGDALTRPTARSVTHAVMTIATEGGREPHFYTTAAGIHNGSQTITADGSSLFDIDMDQLSHLLLPQPDPSERAASDSLAQAMEHQREDWLAEKAETVHCLLNAAACRQQPLAKAAARSASTALTQDVETQDFVAWLASHAHLKDQVVVHMDLGQGREFELLQALLMSNTLELIDHLALRWHYQLANWHLVLLWEQIFALLGLQYTSITG